MAMVQRDQAGAPGIRTERVPVPGLKGDVIVRSRTLADRISLGRFRDEQLRKGPAGESEADAQVRVGAAIVSKTLSLQVVLDDGQPLYSTEGWEAWGADHATDVLALYDKCQGLAAPTGVEDVLKNFAPSPSDAQPSRSLGSWVARLLNSRKR